MAVVYDATGPSSAGAGNINTSTLSWSHTTGTGAILLVGCAYGINTSDSGRSIACTVDGSATGVSSLGVVHSNNGTAGFLQVWQVTGLSATSHTILITGSGGTPGSLAGGSMSFLGAGSLGAPVTGYGTGAATKAVGSTSGSNMVAGFLANGLTISSATSPSTSRYIINETTTNGGAAGCAAAATSPSTGSNVTMAWSAGSDWWAFIGVEVLDAAGGPTTVTPACPAGSGAASAPAAGAGTGWLYAGAASGTGWATTSAATGSGTGDYATWTDTGPGTTGTLELSSFGAQAAVPSGAAIDQVTLKIRHGENPAAGVDSVTAQAYAGASARGTPQALTVSDTVHEDTITVTGISYADLADLRVRVTATAAGGDTYLAGLAGGATGYFVDGNGTPRLKMSDAAWALLINAGRWTAGDWQGDIDNYMTVRGGQGFNTVVVAALGSTHIGGLYADGRNCAGASPFATTSPLTLNDTYWQRLDYLLASAQAAGITVMLNLGAVWDTVDAGGAMTGMTTTQYTAYGTALGNRYKDVPNLIWMSEDDYYGDVDTQLSGMLGGIRGTGDTHVFSEQTHVAATSRRDFSGNSSGFGSANAQFDHVYSYNVTYFGVEYGWQETSHGESVLIPVTWGDGFFLGEATNGVGGAGADNATERRIQRQMTWWALSSGARGISAGSNYIWEWDTNAASHLSTETWYASVAGVIRAYVESLPGWQNLFPDVSSQLVTAGRGTHASNIDEGSNARPAGWPDITDAYVTASRVSDGSLAVIYMSHAASITIDESKMAAGYTAWRVDPVTCSETSVTAGSTYASSGWGNNSAGGADWLLVLKG